ncbi:MAG: TolC family protein, partial [Lewinella sp.]|nr:TolC family protein [Lewinella sp.]
TTLFRYYDTEALPLAEEQMEAAELSYREGAIDYVTYIQNLDAAIRIERDYLDTQAQFYDLLVRIKFILNQ